MALALLQWGAAPAHACPTSLNLIPTADVLEAGIFSVELELDGAADPLLSDRSLYLFAQVGLTDRLEAGVDVWDLTDGRDVQANVKWQVIPESDHVPAVAVGLLDLGRRGTGNGWYVALAKDVGSIRAHGGVITDGAARGMLGVEYYPTDRTGLMADWTTGASGYHSLGVTHDIGHGYWLSAYYARSNSARPDDFVGLNLYWEGIWND